MLLRVVIVCGRVTSMRVIALTVVVVVFVCMSTVIMAVTLYRLLLYFACLTFQATYMVMVVMSPHSKHAKQVYTKPDRADQQELACRHLRRV